MSESPFDPEYQSAARFLPRGIARSWNLPLVRMLGALAAARLRIRRTSKSKRLGSGHRSRPPAGTAGGERGRCPPCCGSTAVGSCSARRSRTTRSVARSPTSSAPIVVAPGVPTGAQARVSQRPSTMPTRHSPGSRSATTSTPSRIAVAGASAGGGLAAQVALHASATSGEIRLAAQILVYPMLDDRTVHPDRPRTRAASGSGTAESNRVGWSAYLGHEAGAPEASPIAVPVAQRQPPRPPARVDRRRVRSISSTTKTWPTRTRLRAADVSMRDHRGRRRLPRLRRDRDRARPPPSVFRESMFATMRKALAAAS